MHTGGSIYAYWWKHFPFEIKQAMKNTLALEEKELMKVTKQYFTCFILFLLLFLK